MNLIDIVIEQMKLDIATGDWTAIEELLKSVPEDKLHGFLSDSAWGYSDEYESLKGEIA